MKKSVLNNIKIINKIIELIIILLTFGYLTSCTDTLGTDPNVKITPVNPVNPPDSSVNNKFPINCKWNFAENFDRDGFQGDSYIWGLNYNTIKNNCLIDTTNGKIALWLDAQMENSIPDNFFVGRVDRVISFRILADSLLVSTKQNELYNLNLNNINIEVQVKDLKSGNKILINQNDVQMFFYAFKDNDNKAIHGLINVDFYPYFSFQTFNFQVVFDAELPK
jgi:hypothetical protein